MKVVVIVILIVIAHALIHEMCHVVIAKLFGLEIKKIQLGYGGLNMLKLGKFFVSPILFGGYVEIDKEKLVSLSKLKILIFFESGCIGNLMLTLIICHFTSGFVLLLCKFYGIAIILTNHFPFGVTDFSMIFKILKEKKRREEVSVG